MHATKLQTSGASSHAFFEQYVISNPRGGECLAFSQSEYWSQDQLPPGSAAESFALPWGPCFLVYPRLFRGRRRRGGGVGLVDV